MKKIFFYLLFCFSHVDVDRWTLETSATCSKSMLLNRMELISDRSDHVINRYRPIKIDDFANRDRSLEISANHSKSMLLNRMELKSDRSDHVINRYRPIKFDDFFFLNWESTFWNRVLSSFQFFWINVLSELRYLSELQCTLSSSILQKILFVFKLETLLKCPFFLLNFNLRFNYAIRRN